MEFAPAKHPQLPEAQTGVLIVNLGTPDATDYWSMRRYLGEFLADPRVVETNRALWWVILNGIILTFRPKKSAHAYEAIWNRERDESPLKTITRAQAEKLTENLASTQPQIVVDWAMRYGNPSIASRLDSLTNAGCTRILLFALYPQYSAATTATAYDKAFDSLRTMRWQPAIRTAPPYHDAPNYIGALSDGVRAHLATLEWEPEVILASFHGLPKDYLEKGDPYYCHCAKTARLLRDSLGMDESRLRLTFQSRFGPREWLQPYTDVTLEELARSGVRRVAVVTPGFAADCVETLEEIAIRGRETFEDAGGTHFTAIPCLNDDDAHMAMLRDLVLKELAGWI